VRPLLVLALAAAAVGCSGSSEAAAPAPTPLQREISGLPARMDALHPDLFHATPRSRFRAQARELARRAPGLSRPQLVVGLMRILALPGVRDGHTGIYPLDPSHARPLRLYPLRLYDFADGLHVVGAIGRPELVGRRVTAIGGIPIARVVQRVRPLVPHDNESGRRWLLPEWVVTYEVLRGLGIVSGERATFAFADGTEVELEPVTAAEIAATVGGAPAPLQTTHDPVWLRRLDEQHWVTTLDGGRVVYVGYRITLGDTFELSERLLRAARRPQVRRVIVDVRLNHGGDNTTYSSLLDALRQPVINRRGRLFVLQGRTTFSAAGNFVADVDRWTKATFVGEPSGGAPNQWGDSQSLTLTRSGLTAHVATSYQEFAPGASRLATMPDVRVDMTAADFFAGRDPVLERALR
jgi:hypothetical protein